MKLAVFTTRYPARGATFFRRDMAALLAAGIEIDLFPIYPLEERFWGEGQDVVGDEMFPPSRVHNLALRECVRGAPGGWGRLGTLLRDAVSVGSSAARFGIAPFAKSAYVFPKAWAWAAQHADSYDHVLAYWGNYAGTCAYLFHRLANRPIPFSIWLHAGTDLYRAQVFLRQKVRYADNVVTCCDFNRRFLHDLYPEDSSELARKIFVTYHGLDLSSFPYRPADRPARRIVAVGRLGRRKGFAYLVRATHELARRGVKVEVEVVGDGEELGNLKALAHELGVADQFVFRGWVQFGEVQEAMSRATALVHPSDGLGDGLPNVLREAMALGTPVIASNVAGIPEALDDGRCGALVPPRDVSALADAMQRVLSDADLRHRYATRGRQRTEALFDVWRNGTRLAERLHAVQRGWISGRDGVHTEHAPPSQDRLTSRTPAVLRS